MLLASTRISEDAVILSAVVALERPFPSIVTLLDRVIPRRSSLYVTLYIGAMIFPDMSTPCTRRS